MANQSIDGQLKQARAALKAGKARDALTISEQLITQFPDDREAWALYPRALARTAGGANFIETLKSKALQSETSALAAAQAALACLNAGRMDEADKFFETAKIRGLSNDDCDHYRAERAWNGSDWKNFIALGAKLAENGRPIDHRQLLKLARAHYHLGNRQQADQIISQIEQSDMFDGNHVVALLSYFVDVNDGHSALVLLEQALDRGINLSPPAINRTILRTGAFLEQTPELTNALKRVKMAGGSSHTELRDAAASDPAELPLDDQRRLSRQLIDQAQSLAIDEDYAAAIGHIGAQLTRNWSEEFQRDLEEFIAVIEQLSQLPPAKRDLLTDFSGDCVVSKPGPDGKVAIVFTGLHDKVGKLANELFDRFLAASGIGAIYLHDHRRMGFCTGVASLGPNATGTVAGLKSVITELGATQLTVIGISMGGYASLRFGLLLDADQILCFSGGTVALPADMKRVGDPRVKIMARRIERSDAEFVEPVRDVLEASQSNSNIQLYFAENMDVDKLQAEDLKDFPNVTLHPISNSTQHGILTTVIGAGGLFTQNAG